MRKHFLTIGAFGLAGLLSLAGCGSNRSNEATPGGFSVAGMTGGDEPLAHGARLVDGPGARWLGLTLEQKASIKRILASHRAAAGKPGEALRAEARGILLAPTVDAAKLRALIDGLPARKLAHLDQLVAVAAEVRSVLTPEQRAKIAAFNPGKGPFAWMQRGFGRHHEHPAIKQLLGDLQLTPAQQAAVDELKTAFRARAEQRLAIRDKVIAAVGAFATSGDQAALKAAIQGIHASPPVDAIVKVATSLDLQQRQRIAEKMDAMKERARRHGPGHGHGPWAG